MGRTSFIKQTNIELTLYTYDSFLFDWDKKEEQLMIDIKNVFEKYKFNIKTKQGYDYDFR